MDKPSVTYVDSPAVTGFKNGVINVAFTTAQYIPRTDADGKVVVDIAEVVTSNLRMDLLCAQQLRDALHSILEQNTTKPKPTDVN